MPLRKSTASPRHHCCRVKLAEKVCLATLSESIVPVRVDRGPVTHYLGLLERAETLSSIHGLLVEWSLVDLESDRIPL